MCDPRKGRERLECINFNKIWTSGKEFEYLAEAVANSELSGDGQFTYLCQSWLEADVGCKKALLTHSCTSALDLAAMLLDLGQGDEVIVPSFTFVSTGNAFVLRGAKPVFVDIRADTLNLDESLIEAAITPRTRAIAPVHYAGVSCEMDSILDIARRHGLAVVEDAAQAIKSTYKGKPLGGLGDLGALSFHATKNVVCGEGGGLLINDPRLVERAEIIREKGTDRSRFFRGEVDKYTWQDMGSSLLPGELTAAFLWAQLQSAEFVTQERIKIWQRYHELLEPLETAGLLRRPTVPEHCAHNGHLYYVILPSKIDRQQLISRMQREGIGTVFHYVPLHSSPAGRKFGRSHGDLSVTNTLPDRLIRLPLWVGLKEEALSRICEALQTALLD